jgi:hypothetical protein
LEVTDFFREIATETASIGDPFIGLAIAIVVGPITDFLDRCP